jgi:hypothetical protein
MNDDLRDRDPRRDDEPDDWSRMVAAFRSAAPRGGAPPWLEQRVMAEVESLPERGLVARVAAWLVRPAPIRVSPLAAAGAAALLAIVLIVPARMPGSDGADGSGPANASVNPTESVVYVQFMLDAPGASSVSVAGDFSEWEPSFTLEDVDGDGVWTGRVPVQPGVHTYMFLIDGTEWRTDPRADRYRDDGFGNRNAVLAVASGA